MIISRSICLPAVQTPPNTVAAQFQCGVRCVRGAVFRDTSSWIPDAGQIGGLGERYELPQRGVGRSPSRNRI